MSEVIESIAIHPTSKDVDFLAKKEINNGQWRS